MWSPSIGVVEVVILILLVSATAIARGAPRRWISVVLCFAVISTVLTPADPVSLLLAAAPLSVAFLVGVVVSPYFRVKRSG